jgi:hypothetical protein
MLSSLLYTMFIIAALPIKESSLEVFNEICILIFSYFIFTITDFVSDDNLKYNIGFVIIVVIAINILINLLVTIK